MIVFANVSGHKTILFVIQMMMKPPEVASIHSNLYRLLSGKANSGARAARRGRLHSSAS
jgi:hypothetical protein